MTVGVSNKRGGEGGVYSRAEERKGRTTVAVATKGIIAVAAGKATLSSLITRVTFGESTIRLRGFNRNSVNNDNFNEVGQLAATCS